MNAENFDLPTLLKMAHSPIHNYVVPGLTSSLIGNPSPAGTVRLFQCSREQQEFVAPHSHRYNLQCWVLKGKVRNTIWRNWSVTSGQGDIYSITSMKRRPGAFGEYDHEFKDNLRFDWDDTVYRAGECYSMTCNQIHSICFGRGAVVLVFEGPELSEESVYLQPVVNGKMVPTFKVEPWMFQKEEHP